jgi:hypothetical protein
LQNILTTKKKKYREKAGAEKVYLKRKEKNQDLCKKRREEKLRKFIMKK